MNGSPPIRAFQWDFARQVERLDFLFHWLPHYAAWGYQELYLHLEDAVEYPSLPGVARADAYTYDQFTRVVAAATAAGIRVVPIINLLGHTQYLIKVPQLRDLNELRDSHGRPLEHGQICPLHPRTLEVAEKLLRDMAPFCTAGKVHVGLDESFQLGRCPRCRAEVSRLGLAGHFAGHVVRLHKLTRAPGLRMGIWADMLALLPAAIPRLPRDVIAYDWYYHAFSRHPCVELRNFAEVDLSAPLRARGIEYWGCPMNGAFRYEPMPVFGERLANLTSWWRRCRRVGAGGFLVTSWEANRLAIELTTAVDAAAACLWLNPGIEDPREMLARGFERVCGANRVGRRCARTALACDELAFAGYHRWQINDRWDVCAGRDGAAPYEREAWRLANLSRGALPAPLAASIAFRRYLAQRDVFARRAAQAVFRLRRLDANSVGRGLSPTVRSVGHSAVAKALADRKARPTTQTIIASLRAEATACALALRAGRAAARLMWRRSRNPHQRGPNELMLDRDAKRLRGWQRWLRRARSHPEIIWRATPVCGIWQLQGTVHNFAPALQKLAVEQQQADGTWRTLHGLPLIEFRTFAARPRAKIAREINVPVADAPKAAPLQIRLAVRGVGQIAVSHIELTNGVTRLHPVGWSGTRRKVLGQPAARHGLPEVDFETNADALLLKFAPAAKHFPV